MSVLLEHRACWDDLRRKGDPYPVLAASKSACDACRQSVLRGMLETADRLLKHVDGGTTCARCGEMRHEIGALLASDQPIVRADRDRLYNASLNHLLEHPPWMHQL